MDEVEYVVPPEDVVLGGTNNTKPPIIVRKKPSKTIGWLKTHKAISIVSLAMAGIVGLVAIVLVSGRPVSILGFQLNPLYNSAAPCSPVDCPVVIEQPLPEPAEPAKNEEEPTLVVATDADSKVNTCLDEALIGKLKPMYRFWSSEYGDHFQTTDPNEKPSGYKYEGITGYVYAEKVENTVPIYRSAQKIIGSHYYTTTDEDPAKYNYIDEGILGYAYVNHVSGSAPWYRMHIGDAISDYVHTVSEVERSEVKELGYADEGIVAHICIASKP